MAKYNLTKQAGGIFVPASDIEAERLTRLKTGCTFEVEIKQSRNQAFHGKVFAFFNFCYEHYFDEPANNSEQFDWFRKRLTIAAGFYVEFNTKKGLIREAKSLAYANMEQEEFENCYKALIQVAMQTIFKGCDESMYEKLYSFF